MKELVISAMLLLSACNPFARRDATLTDNGAGEMPEPQTILTQMRTDTLWIRRLEEMADSVLGPGARCLDPVWHLFLHDDRTWFFNQDWGGVLEIPSDFIPEDDEYQAYFSFHGTRAFSPDSLVVVSFYAGGQGLTIEEKFDAVQEDLVADGFRIVALQMDDRSFAVHALSNEGIHYYGRDILDDVEGIEYSVSIQYPDGQDVSRIIPMVDRYPFGPVTDR